MINKITSLLCLLVICFSGTVAARSYDDIIESDAIKIAVYNNFPPYSFKDKKGKPQGIDIEVAQAIAKQLGVKKLEWLWIDADETVEDDLRNAIWKGRKIDRQKADLMMRVPYDSKFSHAVDGYGLPRNELVVMFAPYHTEFWSIARNLDIVGTSRNLAIFRFEKIGVEIDSLPDSYLLSAYNGVLQKNVTHFDTLEQAAQAMIKKQVAAIVGMHSQVVWSLGKKAKKFDIDDDGLGEMASKPWNLGIATGHEFRQLSYKVGDIVSQLIEKGELAKIFKKYGLDYQIPDYYQPDAE